MNSRRDITNSPNATTGGKSNTGRSVDKSRSSRDEVTEFLSKLNELDATKTRPTGRGRLIFAMDATMSRQPTWDMALSLQTEMFNAVANTGGATSRAIPGLDVQLVYFRGFGECRNSKWVSDAAGLARLMTTVSCRGGKTQIRKVLLHAERETDQKPVNALVYVGDCMEENIDELAEIAGRLGLKGVPLFLFQEGPDPNAERAFREFARLSGGAYCRFDAGAADQLRDLLKAVAVFASGGMAALENLGGSGGTGAKTRLLIEQLK